MNLQYFL